MKYTSSDITTSQITGILVAELLVVLCLCLIM